MWHLRIGLVAILSGLVPVTAQGGGKEGQSKDVAVTHGELNRFLKDEIPVRIKGGTFLWHYQPFLTGAKPDTSVYWAYLQFDVDMEGDIDFHLETMFRDRNLRPFFNSNVWVQEVYLDWKPDDARRGHVKVGKVYSKFGQFWDGSFYGNVPYFDGLKLDPDIGVSYELDSLELCENTKLAASLQYFTRDGSTNGSLQGRDTLSLPMAVQRDSFVGRIAPTFSLGDDSTLTVGASAMTFKADLDQSAGMLGDQVVRWGAEAKLTVADFEVFGEAAWQRGTHAPGYPRPGVREDEILWVMSGVSFDVTDRLKLAYNFSSADYNRSNVREIFHMPRLEFALTSQASIWLEYVHWIQQQAGPDIDLDDSLNLVFYCHF